MKHLIVLAFTVFSLTATSQQQKKAFIKNHSPEEIATLKSKKLTLHLNLTESQEQEIYSLLLDQAKNRKQMVDLKKDKTELSKEEAYQKKVTHLEKQILFKRKIKTILTEEQFKRFEKMSLRRKKHRREKREKA